jgi:hypothetical protein
VAQQETSAPYAEIVIMWSVSYIENLTVAPDALKIVVFSKIHALLDRMETCSVNAQLGQKEGYIKIQTVILLVSATTCQCQLNINLLLTTLVYTQILVPAEISHCKEIV